MVLKWIPNSANCTLDITSLPAYTRCGGGTFWLGQVRGRERWGMLGRQAQVPWKQLWISEFVPCWQGILLCFCKLERNSGHGDQWIEIIYKTCFIILQTLPRWRTIWHAYTYTGTSCRCCWQEKSFRRGSILIISSFVADNCFSNPFLHLLSKVPCWIAFPCFAPNSQ